MPDDGPPLVSHPISRAGSRPVVLSDRQGFDRRWFAPNLQAVFAPTHPDQVVECLTSAIQAYGRDMKKPFPADQVAAIYKWLHTTPQGIPDADMTQSLLQVDSYGAARSIRGRRSRPPCRSAARS